MLSQADGNEGTGQIMTIVNPPSAVASASTPGVVGNLPGRSSPGNASSGMEKILKICDFINRMDYYTYQFVTVISKAIMNNQPCPLYPDVPIKK